MLPALPVFAWLQRECREYSQEHADDQLDYAQVVAECLALLDFFSLFATPRPDLKPDDFKRILFDDDDTAIIKAARMHSQFLNLLLHEERASKALPRPPQIQLTAPQIAQTDWLARVSMNIGTFQALLMCYLETQPEFVRDHADVIQSLLSVDYCYIKVSHKLEILHFLRDEVCSRCSLECIQMNGCRC